MAAYLNEKDLEAIKILDGFLPDRIFDAHMHLSNYRFGADDYFGFEEYYRDVKDYFGNRQVRCMALATPTAEQKCKDKHISSIKFLGEQLDGYPECVGAILVKPEESAEEISSHLIHKSIRGLKCYHIYSKRSDTFNADIHEYLPESALEVANSRSMTVTLHMVKDAALADRENMRQIKDISKRYSNMRLVLAHAARSFASWTAIESVTELMPYENIFFDFSGICESPAMIRILKKFGVSRCMWGSDYNVSKMLGKAVSLGDGFYWMDKDDVAAIDKKASVRARHVGTENLMAVREAAIISELTPREIEELFYGTACKVFK